MAKKAPSTKSQTSEKQQIPKTKLQIISNPRRSGRLLESFQNSFVGTGEWEILQLAKAQPLTANPGKRCCTVGNATKAVERDAIAGDRVFNGAERFDSFEVKSESSFSDIVNIGFSVEFRVWKFPEVRIDDASGALLNEITGISFDDESVESSTS